MNKKKTLLVICLFMLALAGIRMIWTAMFAVPDSPRAAAGVLDLRGWELPANRTIPLDGEWTFFPYVQTSGYAETAPASVGNPVYMEVPGSWKPAFVDMPEKDFWYGTYRLRILVDPAEEASFGFYVRIARQASELFANGQTLGSMGTPSEQEAHFVPRLGTYTSYVTLNEDESAIDLFLFVSGYGPQKDNGITRSVKFGTAESVEAERNLSVNLQLLLCTVLLVFSTFSLILYFLGARQKSLIYFSLLIVCTIVSVLASDDRLLFEWMPISYEWSIKIFSLSYTGISLYILLLCRELLPDHNSRELKIIRWAVILYALNIAYIFLVPAAYIYLIRQWGGLLHAFAFLALVWLIYRQMRSRSEDLFFLLLAATSVVSSSVWSQLRLYIHMPDMIYYPFDLIIAFFGFAAFWFKRYFRNAAEVERLALRLRQADKQKDEFLANTSHELRNPLHGMINIAQAVLNNNKHSLQAEDQQNLQLLSSVGQRMTLLLNDLLDISRLKDKRIHLKTAPMHIQSAVSGVLDILRFMTEGKPIRLESKIPDSFPRVVADESRLIQMLFNLTHNAIKYTEAGTVEISASVVNGHASIRIADPGIGMDEDTLRRVFDPYEQGDLSGRVGGMGLGLSISKQLAELHGGTLEAESAPGKGSVFRFTLPLAETDGVDPQLSVMAIAAETAMTTAAAETAASSIAASVAESPSSATAAERDMPRILAVDDDPVNLRILQGIFSAESVSITTAIDGKDALAKLEGQRWDLVIADVMMPHLSGYELTRIIRARFSVSELPVLLLTARSHPEDVQAGFAAGANDYVTKPIHAVELKSRARSLIELKQSVTERVRMEAAWLQAQIQPHFLFNTLNTIGALSDIDTTRMRLLLDKFGWYLQTSFNSLNMSPLIPIEHEMKLVRSYLYIEKERFEEKLNVIWEVDTGIRFELPPLTIQPIVENAVRHGLMSRPRGGTLRVRIADTAEVIEVAISDDGQGMDPSVLQSIVQQDTEHARGIGLRNVDRRLKQMYGNGLHIESSPGKGTQVSFCVPKHS